MTCSPWRERSLRLHALNDDHPGFVTEEPEHCPACIRLIRPGQTYYLTLEHQVLCADCALDDAPR